MLFIASFNSERPATQRMTTHLGREVEVHVLTPLLHLGQQVRRRGAQDVVDLLDLIQLVGPREEREQGHDLEEHAAHAPHVHLVVVVAVREQALRGSVPARGDVLRVGLFAVDAPAGAEVGELQTVVHDQDVLRLGGYGRDGEKG